jgi:hypothetical protein
MRNVTRHLFDTLVKFNRLLFCNVIFLFDMGCGETSAWYEFQEITFFNSKFYLVTLRFSGTII